MKVARFYPVELATPLKLSCVRLPYVVSGYMPYVPSLVGSHTHFCVCYQAPNFQLLLNGSLQKKAGCVGYAKLPIFMWSLMIKH